jgi:hypothetical protein
MDSIDIFEIENLEKLLHRENGKLETLKMSAEMYRQKWDDSLIVLLKRAGIFKQYFKQSDKVVNIERELAQLKGKAEREKWFKKTGKKLRTQFPG